MAKATSNRSGNVLYIVLAVIGLGLLAAVGYAFVGGSGGAATEPVEIPEANDPQALFERATAMKMGPDDAVVKVVEFGDYQCPACAAFATQSRPLMEQRFMDTGKVQFIYYDFPLLEIHPNSFLAARAARCAAEQDLFWEYHDALFQNQTQWSPMSGPVGQFVEYMETLGGDTGPFEACVKSDRYADVVTANRLMGEQLRVNSTPTVIVNSRRITGSTMREMTSRLVATIEEELGG